MKLSANAVHKIDFFSSISFKMLSAVKPLGNLVFLSIVLPR